MPRKMNDKTATLAQLRKMMNDFVSRRQWHKYHRPKNLAMSIAIETAELMEHFQWLDHDQADAALADPALRQQVADEMADVLSFLLSMSNATGIDLSAAFARKMKKTVRKYPAAKCKENYSKPRAMRR